MTSSQHEHAHRAHAVAMGRAPRRRRFMRGFMHGLAGWRSHDLRRRTLILFRSRFMLRMLLGSALCFAVVMIAALGLWWRLSSGPIELNLATPWLKAAIEENFGGNHSVAVGGTQLERDEKGRTSLRLRDIVVRDADGTVVASAPKAEVGLSSRSLLMGRLRAQSLNLVGAEMFFSSRGNFDTIPGTNSLRDRLSSEGWQSCASCHFKGLTDGVIWQFAAGPRKSVSRGLQSRRVHDRPQRSHRDRMRLQNKRYSTVH